MKDLDFKKIIEEEAKIYSVNYRDLVKKNIEQATLSLLGLEKRSHSIEIDHCNSRNSVLIDAFRDQAIDEARKIAKDYKASKEDLKIYRASFRREVSSNISREIRELARVKAKEVVAEIGDKIKFDIEKMINKG